MVPIIYAAYAAERQDILYVTLGRDVEACDATNSRSRVDRATTKRCEQGRRVGLCHGIPFPLYLLRRRHSFEEEE